jgi:hypothetical protein
MSVLLRVVGAVIPEEKRAQIETPLRIVGLMVVGIFVVVQRLMLDAATSTSQQMSNVIWVPVAVIVVGVPLVMWMTVPRATASRRPAGVDEDATRRSPREMGTTLARRAFAALVTTVTLVACVEPEFPHDGTIAARVCNAVCARHVACQPSKWNEQACESSCLAHRTEAWKYAGGHERKYWREDYVDAVLQCTQAASCDDVESERAYFSRCFNDTRPPPSDAANRYCAAYRESVRACGGDKAGADCAGNYGQFSDGVLNELTTCLKSGCRASSQCTSAFVTSVDE